MLMRGLRSLALGTAAAAIWPSYLLLLAYLARQAPWPRNLGILASATLVGLAMAELLRGFLKWLARPSGWAEHYLGMPAPVARQLGRAGRFAVAAAAGLLLPVYVLDQGLIAPEGRPLNGPVFSRFLILAFELALWGTWVRLLRPRSPLWTCLANEGAGEAGGGSADLSSGTPAGPDASAATGNGETSRVQAGLLWFSRRRRAAAGFVLAAIATVILLDVRGFSFSARRLAIAASQTAAVMIVGAAVYRALARMIDRHVVRWSRLRRRSWALALTSAVALRASARSRNAAPSRDPAAGTVDPTDPGNLALQPADLSAGLNRLVACALTALGVFVVAWLWDLDLALLRFLLNQPLWFIDEKGPVTVGDLMEAGGFILAGALAWRYMSAFFALTVFHRLPDDPGVRFAIVTLCRYAVLALTAIGAMGAVHIDMAKISVVLAALGVGLGFGLQEVISNFVCGIILLLERPIRIGDVVTVSGTSGRVDRIHIRATTIINADNQCMIVPNREFITGNLVNWTHKDKILRVPIKVNVAYGTDPDQVVDLLLSIARRDSDVLFSPAPAALMEGFGESALSFALNAFVPDPGLVGPVRHRLCAEIQRRFAEEGIVIPLPMRELRLSGASLDAAEVLQARTGQRVDAASPTPPDPHQANVTTRASRDGDRLAGS
jgi:potassium efflux system protein